MLKVLDNGDKDKLSKDGKFSSSSTERARSKAAVSVHLRRCNKALEAWKQAKQGNLLV